MDIHDVRAQDILIMARMTVTHSYVWLVKKERRDISGYMIDRVTKPGIEV